MGDGKSAPSAHRDRAARPLEAPRRRDTPPAPTRACRPRSWCSRSVRQDAAVVSTVMVPNRIWKDIRDTGFEGAAIDAVKRAKFAAGTKDGQPAELWTVVAVKFAR